MKKKKKKDIEGASINPNTGTRSGTGLRDGGSSKILRKEKEENDRHVFQVCR